MQKNLYKKADKLFKATMEDFRVSNVASGKRLSYDLFSISTGHPILFSFK